jgi:hypothetical protein
MGPSLRQMGISAIAGLHIRITAGNRGIIFPLQPHDDSGNRSTTSPKESSALVLICCFLVPYTFFSYHGCAVHNTKPAEHYKVTSFQAVVFMLLFILFSVKMS